MSLFNSFPLISCFFELIFMTILKDIEDISNQPMLVVLLE